MLLNKLNALPLGKTQNPNLNNDNVLIGNINNIVDGVAKGMQEIGCSFRLTDGKNKGNNFSPKYYEKGFNGGSKAGIKTYKAAKIGKQISEKTGSIGIALTTKSITDAIKEDGIKLGDNTIKAFSEEAGGWSGLLARCKSRS